MNATFQFLDSEKNLKGSFEASIDVAPRSGDRVVVEGDSNFQGVVDFVQWHVSRRGSTASISSVRIQCVDKSSA